MSQFPPEKGGGSGFGFVFFFVFAKQNSGRNQFQDKKHLSLWAAVIFEVYSILQTEMTVYGSAFGARAEKHKFRCGIKDSSRKFTQEDLR